MKEYKVIWERKHKDGQTFKKSAVFQRNKSALRKVELLASAKPWEALGKDPDAAMCCGRSTEDRTEGPVCMCEEPAGSFRQRTAEIRKDLPELLWVRIYEREVGAWQPTTP